MSEYCSLDVELAKQGDADAFARLYSIVYKDLFNIALYSLRSEQDAQDVVSDTIIDAFVGIKKLREVGAFRPWIMRILSIKIKRKYRDYAQSANVVQLDFAENIAVEDDHEGVELLEAFSKLSDEERLIVSMSVLSGYTSQEISDFIGYNASTIRSKLMRAKSKMKQRLDEK